jgi:hypothetical protein
MIEFAFEACQVENLRQIAQQRAISRREFLRSAAVTGTSSRLFGFGPLRAAIAPREQKTVVVTFGGGARDEETFAPEGQENIPHLMNELIPQGTFCTQVVNHGILGHYVATASLATGVYESGRISIVVRPLYSGSVSIIFHISAHKRSVRRIPSR